MPTRNDSGIQFLLAIILMGTLLRLILPDYVAGSDQWWKGIDLNALIPAMSREQHYYDREFAIRKEHYADAT